VLQRGNAGLERVLAVFFARDYVEPSAVDVFGARWGLPQAISARNNYFLWGPGGHDGAVVLLLSRAPRDDVVKANVALGASARIGEQGAVRAALLKTYAYPFERGLTLWLCRDRKVSFAGDWAKMKL
jgi:hypothetical protein